MTSTALASYHCEGYATETAIITAGPVVLHSDERSFPGDAAGAQAVLHLNCQRDPVTQAWELATETHDAGFTMATGSPTASAAPAVAMIDGEGNVRQRLQLKVKRPSFGKIVENRLAWAF